MKLVKITTLPAIYCPLTKKHRLVQDCQKCDAYKGVENQLAKDGSIPVRVKCGSDEF